MSFFSQGKVDTKVVDRSKLPVGTYLVSLTDFKDVYGATAGDRTQCDFVVEEGCVEKGRRGAHVVMHAADKAWKMDKARGEIAATLGAFFGFNRDTSGLKVDAKFFAANARVIREDGGKTVSVSCQADELPGIGKQAFLVVAPYFDKKTGVRKHNPKTGQPSVTYELFPLSAKLTVTHNMVAGEVAGTDDFGGDAPEVDDAPPAPSASEPVDGLAAALADGWKRNGETPWFYKKGAPAQLKEAALRAQYGE
jgi:hypothetical protein